MSEDMEAAIVAFGAGLADVIAAQQKTWPAWMLKQHETTQCDAPAVRPAAVLRAE